MHCPNAISSESRQKCENLLAISGEGGEREIEIEFILYGVVVW